MSMSRAGTLIVSSCGAALLVAAAGVVWMGVESNERAGADTPAGAALVRAKLGPSAAGGAAGPASIGPAPIGGTEGQAPVSLTESLVLQKGETYYGKGEAFYKDGDYTSATRYLQAEVESHPDRFYPSYLLGLSLWKEAKLDEAITTLTSAASLDAHSVKARVNLGRVLNEAGSFDRALQAADEAIALDPDSSAAHNVRGRALLNLDRKNEAVDAFRTAVEKDPENAYAQNNLGYALIRAGRFAEAVPSLEEAVRLKPEIGYFQNNLGMAYERTAQTEKAKETYRKATETGGSDRAARNLARLGGAVDDEKAAEDGGNTSH